MSKTKKASQLKVIEGTFRGDRDSHGPSVEFGAPGCPVWLPKSAKRYWKKVAPELEKSGLIAKIDVAFFGAFCDSVGKFEDITRELQTLDDMMAKTPQGFMVQNVLMQIRNKLWDQIKSGSGEFGLTPVARNKVDTSGQKSLLDDEWESL